MKRVITGAAALALGLSLAACSPGTPASPVSLPAYSPPPAPAATPGITVSCKPVPDPGSSAPPGKDLTPEVTLTANDLVTTTPINVTVITFNAVGVQNATAVITFNGPFAPGQTFTAYSNTDVYDNNASCAVADVSGPVAGEFTYRNDSPVPGAS